MPDDNATPPSALDQATRERDRFRDRAAWWEDHKGVVMLPAMIVGLGAGYGLGFGIGSAVGFPDPTRWFGAVIGLLAVGRAIGSYFDPRRLVAAQKRVDHLRAQNDRTR